MSERNDASAPAPLLPTDPAVSEAPPPPPDDQTPWGPMPGPATSDRTLRKMLHWDALKKRFAKRVAEDSTKAGAATSHAVSVTAEKLASKTAATSKGIREALRNAFDTAAAKVQRWRDGRDDVE